MLPSEAGKRYRRGIGDESGASKTLARQVERQNNKRAREAMRPISHWAALIGAVALALTAPRALADD